MNAPVISRAENPHENRLGHGPGLVETLKTRALKGQRETQRPALVAFSPRGSTLLAGSLRSTPGILRSGFQPCRPCDFAVRPVRDPQSAIRN